MKIYIIKTKFVEREKEQEENSQFNYNWFFLPQLPPPKPRVWEQRPQGVTPKEDEENERDGERKSVNTTTQLTGKWKGDNSEMNEAVKSCLNEMLGLREENALKQKLD